MSAPTTSSPSQPELVAELNGCLAESIRLAASRAEHIRLIRMQGIVDRLASQLALSEQPAPN